MQIIILTVSMLLATCVTSVIKSAQEGAGQHRLHRRMNALPSPELDDLSLKGWNYLSLMFLPAETTGRIIQEWIAEGKEPGGSNGHRQRDWLTETDFASIPGWTFSPCADEEHSLQSIFDALVNVLPKGESAQPRTRKPDRVNVGLMAPEGPNRCFVWKQDERYTSVSGQINMVRPIFTPENETHCLQDYSHRPAQHSSQSTTCATALPSSKISLRQKTAENGIIIEVNETAKHPARSKYPRKCRRSKTGRTSCSSPGNKPRK